MTPLAKNLLDRVASWPDEDIAELNELAREIEARRTGVYVIDETEWADLQESLREADRKEFVSHEVIEQAIHQTSRRPWRKQQRAIPDGASQPSSPAQCRRQGFYFAWACLQENRLPSPGTAAPAEMQV
jgi:hypothetical protein